MNAGENVPGPTKKRKTYVSSFQNDWTARSDYRNWLIKIDNLTAKCTLCSVIFTVKHDGEKAIKTHLNSVKLKGNCKNVATNQLMSAFVMTKGSSEELKIAAAEISEVYHGIRHHHSYLSIDCGVKLLTQIFSDSNIVKKLHCGRTKAEAIVENVLAPKSIEMVVHDLIAGSSRPVAFSIATDASNKGHRKFFPIAIKYFDIKVGVKDRIIEFFENSDESSASIYEHIISCVEDLGLDMTNVTSYTADNASVNYGKNNSVYQKLTATNKGIIKSNCNCHVIHNAARHACKALSYDVENLVLKVYADFANSAKKTAKLKECFEFLNLEYEDVVRHVVTRWLSLFRAVKKLIHCWPAVKEYFITQGQENTHKVIWSFVGGQEDELQDDLHAAFSLSECYLYFVHHFNIMDRFNLEWLF